MELDKNKFKYYEHQHKTRKKLNKKILVFSGFVFVIGMVVFTTLYSNSSITGGTISSINQNNSITISAELNVPDLSFKGEYSEIEILFDSKTTIYLGEKSFTLDDLTENRIILKGFSGNIKIDEDGILLDGKVSDVNLNYLPITDKNNKKIKISGDSKIHYNLVEFKKNLFLKEIDYTSSGILFVGQENQDKIILNEDSISISNYFGKLRISKDTLFLNGFAEDVEIEGDMKSMSISK